MSDAYSYTAGSARIAEATRRAHVERAQAFRKLLALPKRLFTGREPQVHVTRTAANCAA
ncbi:hypothetical protein [Oceanomicrobium pacificus]|uniref:Uncharacterized protein n=1 Tax=Oceanomicrobium pacificus TaxID=2692916 RepID=A0A6B0TQE8_9RHOB|nr:hypothetical protein [Oceanomicrobium pacificus]MXU63998.1 hypothetical protein [Oceanomicrobium pacificus]